MNQADIMATRVTLLTVARGSAALLFDRELDRALENCEDQNTPFSKKRKIILEVTLEPTDDSRKELAISVSASSKLAAVNPVVSTANVGRVKGAMMAFESNALQDGLFDPSANKLVTDLVAGERNKE